MKTHIETVHKGIRKHACPYCDKRFSQKANLRTHVKTLHEELRYPCYQCEYQAKRKAALQIHVESQHEGIQHACKLCNFQTKQKYYLKIHIHSQHSTDISAPSMNTNTHEHEQSLK